MTKPLSGNGTQETASAPPKPPPAGGDSKPEEIARLAYQYWQQRVHPIGTPEEEDWSRAEEEIKQRENKPPTSAEPEPNPPHPGVQTGPPGSESATEDAPAKEKAPAKEASAKEAPTKEAPVKEAAPAKEAPAKEAPVEEGPAKDAPAKEPPAKEAAAKDAPAKEPPAKEAAAKSWIASDKGSRFIKLAFGILLLLNVAVAAYFIWQHFRPKPLGEGFASGNGRIEAVDVDIAAKSPGRISEMLVDDGDIVTAGQIVAKMDTKALQAELQQAPGTGSRSPQRDGDRACERESAGERTWGVFSRRDAARGRAGGGRKNR